VTTLRIEHPVTDFELWQTTFARFAPARAQSGVRAQRVYRPLDDPCYVLIDLDFDSPEEAEQFLRFLETTVWASRDSSPALDGAPQTRLLDRAEIAEPAPAR
jgi:hypothetical protein